MLLHVFCRTRLTLSTSLVQRVVLSSFRTPSAPFFSAIRNALKMAIKDLVENQEALSDSVRKFVCPVNEAAQSSDDALEKSLWKSWNELIEIAVATRHPHQGPLVEFVKELRKEPSPKKQNGESCKIWGNSVEWKNLPLLGP